MIVNCEEIEGCGKENCFTFYWLLFVTVFKVV